MQEEKGSHTAELVAFARAIGTHEKDAKVRNPDVLAQNLIGAKFRFALLPGIRQLVTAHYERLCPGMYLYHQARTLHFDAFLTQQLNSNRPDQLVVLGAGFDSRAYRFAKALSGVRVFEVDHPETGNDKRQRLGRWSGPKDHVTFVAVDFNNEPLDVRLEERGFDFSLKTCFIWEGVIYYLSESAVEETLGVLAGAARGSTLSFDYVEANALTHPDNYYGAAGFLEFVAHKKEPVMFGLDRGRVADFLEPHGFSPVSILTSQELQERYLRLADGSFRGRLCGAFSIVQAKKG